MKDHTGKTWVKILGFFGIVTPMIAFACILSAIALAPSFSWTDNALSDLGIMSGPTAALFNVGLIISGIMTVLFASGLFLTFEKEAIGQFGATVLLLCGVTLSAIGIFPENVKPMHIYASVTFFALFPISMFILTASYFLAAKPKKASFTLSVAVFATLVWILQFLFNYAPGRAIPETLSALAASLWAVVLGFNMMRSASQSRG